MLMALTGALGVPYLMVSDGWKKLSQGWGRGEETAGHVCPDDRLAAPEEDDIIAVPPQPVEGAGVERLDEVFNFNIDKSWVLSRWPRVFTGLQEADPKRKGYVLQGYRVPLVTGVEIDDLAGSLTYYFNHLQQPQRITFEGSTGDAGRLVKMLVRKYDFRAEKSNDPAKHVCRSYRFGHLPSEIQIHESRRQRSTAPHTRYNVALVLER